ncbi:hypothetical protein [Novosphingobium sp. EMRT-2]|uniref:hypothetical protein n=1 Tax=Novosphingobium sp. EMRT-2 TaxID=2571749 RepID=UPI0010BE07A5|nr:hypothetical protein [Novosphingobium sp. EMRT-2]QCI92208.1 hypothetical protein FA702_00575 [Novosphingobium sp. EMRT-2]
MIPAALVLFAALLASVHLARRWTLLRHFGDLAAIGRRSVRTLARSGVSDWSKERATRILAIRMMGKSLAAGGLLLMIALPIAAVLAIGPVAGIPTQDALFDPTARLSILAAGIALAFLRSRVRRLGLRHA